MEYKLVAVDMDGTLLTPQLEISKDTVETINKVNDMDMIQYAGLGVAMGNAPDYLKDVAEFVTHSNDEDGVRHVLEKFILN